MQQKCFKVWRQIYILSKAFWTTALMDKWIYYLEVLKQNEMKWNDK